MAVPMAKGNRGQPIVFHMATASMDSKITPKIKKNPATMTTMKSIFYPRYLLVRVVREIQVNTKI